LLAERHFGTHRQRKVAALVENKYLMQLTSWFIHMVNVTVICGHITFFMLLGNTAYWVKLSYEDQSRVIRTKPKSVGLRKCPHYHYLTEKVVSQ